MGGLQVYWQIWLPVERPDELWSHTSRRRSRWGEEIGGGWGAEENTERMEVSHVT